MDVGRSRARRSSPTGCARSRAVRTIEIDEGWSDDRDVSVFVGRWAWLDVRALVEEHGGGKALLRVSTHLRPTSFGVVERARRSARRCWSARRAPAWRCAGRWPAPSPRRSPLAFIALRRVWRTAQTTAIVRRGIARVTARQRHGRACASGPARVPLIAPSLLRMLRPAQRVHLRRDDRRRSAPARSCCARRRPAQVIGGAARATPATTARRSQAWLDTPGGIAVAPNGDIYFADSNNHVIRRIDARDQRHRAGRRQPRPRQRLLGRQRAGHRGAARHAGRRRDRAGRRPHRRRLAQRPHPPRRSADRHHHHDRRIGRERLRRRRQAGDRGGAQHAERGGGRAERRHLHRRHAELPRPDDRRADRPHPHRRRRRRARRQRRRRRRRAGDQRAPEHAERRRDRAERRHLHRRHAPQPRAQGRRARRASSRPSPAAARWGHAGDDGPATQATLAGPAGIARRARAERHGRRSSSPTTTTGTCARSVPTASSAT